MQTYSVFILERQNYNPLHQEFGNHLFYAKYKIIKIIVLPHT